MRRPANLRSRSIDIVDATAFCIAMPFVAAWIGARIGLRVLSIVASEAFDIGRDALAGRGRLQVKPESQRWGVN